MRFWPVLILVLLVACAAQAPPTPAAVIGVQTVQDQHNRVPLLEGKVTLFLAADGQPVSLWRDGKHLPNPLPADLATGRVTARTQTGETQDFTFTVAAPLQIQLLPISIGREAAPSITPADLRDLELAVVTQLPFSGVSFEVLPARHLTTSNRLWPDVLSLAKRHGTRQAVTIAVIPHIPGQEFNGYALINQRTAGLMLRNHAQSHVNTGLFLHELAHALGARHAPCGDAANPDRHYPDPTGRIPDTDVLFNSATSQVLKGDWHDLMSYCHPRWPSVFTTLKVLK